MLERKKLKGRTQVTFVLPEDIPPAPVSVVGDFNHWNPHAHPLAPRGDGTRTATVALPTGSSHAFRYLAAGDYWFDDDSADHHDGTNGRIHT
ncbi:isoamylase early set domain-containing protein [Streptomyces sp. NPDC096030]|uniref:isoamylase early set domain-containing protein n=1 Tax=Streptomyces sp. NPDC096030 TaxID=3155423 RepID=UPI00332F31C6